MRLLAHASYLKSGANFVSRLSRLCPNGIAIFEPDAGRNRLAPTPNGGFHAVRNDWFPCGNACRDLGMLRHVEPTAARIERRRHRCRRWRLTRLGRRRQPTGRRAGWWRRWGRGRRPNVGCQPPSSLISRREWSVVPGDGPTDLHLQKMLPGIDENDQSFQPLSISAVELSS